MAEWLYEVGIGEVRAALVEGGTIVEATIELDDDALRVGGVHEARLVEPDLVRIGAHEAQVTGVPSSHSLGRTLTVEIVREAIPEPGRAKPAKARVTESPLALASSLLERIAATGLPIRRLAAHEPDALESAGWSELLEEAVSGEIGFSGGALRMTPTPAMTLFDVDGGGDLERLAVGAATAVARAIRRMRIGGSIGVDVPTLVGKAPRQAAAAAIDATLPQPFERTAVNGFGFLQIVRPRPRASLPELLRVDPVGAAARAALRTIERVPPTAANRHRLPPPVRERIERHPEWLAELMRRTGRTPIFDS